MALVYTLILFALAVAAKFLMEEFNIGEVWNARAESYTRTAYGNEIHSLLKRLSRWSLIFSLFAVVDRYWLPWLDIRKVAFGRGKWRHIDPVIRAAVALGWFLTLFGFLNSFSSGI